MKNTLKIILAAIFALAFTRANAHFVYDSSTQRIQKIQIHRIAVSASDTTVVDKGLYYPPAIDPLTALRIMREGEGEIDLNYQLVEYKNPFWFLYEPLQVTSDAYLYAGGIWKPEIGRKENVHSLFSFWYMILLFATVFAPAGIGLLLVKLKGASFNVLYFIFAILFSIIIALLPLSEAYLGSKYAMHLNARDTYKHFLLLPLVILLFIYIGRWMFRSVTQINSVK